jgi:hypothetical protein
VLLIWTCTAVAAAVVVLLLLHQVILVNRLTDQQLCVAEEQAVTNVADAASFGEVQKVQVRTPSSIVSGGGDCCCAYAATAATKAPAAERSCVWCG